MTLLKTFTRAAGLGLCVVAFAGTAVAGNGNGNGKGGTPPGQEKKAEQTAPAPAATAPAPAPAAAAAPEAKGNKGQEKKAEKQVAREEKKAAEGSVPAAAATSDKDKSDKDSGSYKNTSSGTDLKKGMSHKHTICHATGSGFVRITPSVSGVFHGHMGHQDERDIVPPFTYKGSTYSLNWNAAGQAIFNAGCAVPGSNVAADEKAKDKNKGKEHETKVKETKVKETKIKHEKVVKSATCPIGMDALSGVSLTATQGGIATGTFTVHSSCTAVKISLASYKSTKATFDAAEVHLQTLFDSKTNVFGAGTHTLTVNVPNCFYQVDLVFGDVITQFSGGNLYGGQGRLIRALNGGTGTCSAPAVTLTPPAQNVTPSPTSQQTQTPQTQAIVQTPAVQAVTPVAVGKLPAATPAVGGVAGVVSPTREAIQAKAAKAKQDKPAGGVLGAVASAPKAIAQTAATGTLPFTGIPLWIAALLGTALLAAGLVLRRAA